MSVLPRSGSATDGLDAGRLGATTYLEPLVILLGWLLLGGVPPALAGVGGAVCLAGVAMSRQRGRVRHRYRSRHSRPVRRGDRTTDALGIGG